jgi:hypothetical protein
MEGKDGLGDASLSCAKVDTLAWFGRATLDVIGLAGMFCILHSRDHRIVTVHFILVGFGYRFNSLTDESNELALAYGTMFSTARKFRVMTILQVWFPILRGFVSPRVSVCSLQSSELFSLPFSAKTKRRWSRPSRRSGESGSH